jgi:hypothetical protein
MDWAICTWNSCTGLEWDLVAVMVWLSGGASTMKNVVVKKVAFKFLNQSNFIHSIIKKI